MAKYLTTNVAYVASVNAGKEVVVNGSGTWDSATLTISLKDGFDTYVAEPNNGSQTANFSYVFTVPEQDGVQLQLSSVGANTNVAVSLRELQS